MNHLRMANRRKTSLCISTGIWLNRRAKILMSAATTKGYACHLLHPRNKDGDYVDLPRDDQWLLFINSVNRKQDLAAGMAISYLSG